MMTEDEAKTKWCPMVRLAPLGPGESYKKSTNRMGKGDPDSCCIASDCMAWRWFGRGAARPDRGYCGLAGKQEAT